MPDMHGPDSAFAVCELASDAVELGRIGAPWGIKGWFKVQSHSASAEALFSCPNWYLLPALPQRQARPAPPAKGAWPKLAHCTRISVADIKPHGEHIVALAEGLHNRNPAEALQGARIFVSRADFPPPENGEYYWVDLIGLQVINRQGQDLGRVKDLIATGPQTVLVITPSAASPSAASPSAEAAERLIPFVDAYIDKVDLKAQVISADWLPDYD